MQDSQKKELESLLLREAAKISSQVTQYIEGNMSIASIEKGLLCTVLSMCLVLLRFIIASKLSLGQGCFRGDVEGKKFTNKGKKERKYHSLFGLLSFKRPAYYTKESGLVYPLDEHLGMPANLWSYNIQEAMANGASEMDFRQSVEVINQILGLNLRGMDSERNVGNVAERVESYYSQCPIPELSDAGQCCCVSFDGKGIPKIKKSESEGESTPPSSRLNSGQKRGVKQMATVVVSAVFTPKIRSKHSIIKGLMKGYEQQKPSRSKIKQNSVPTGETVEIAKVQTNENDNQWLTQNHCRAFLADQEQAIQYGLQRVKAQLKQPTQRFVVPIDGGSGLESKVLHYVKEYGLENHFDGIILDIVHVLEYVWEAANALLGDKSPLRSQWVADVLQDILDSKTEKVIANLDKILDKTKLSSTQKDQIQKAITYFKNHAHKMDYKTYLDKGYPVSSALVEAKCKHLVKDRMEQSGMRWSDTGAQAMLDIRALKLNGHLADFIAFVERNNRKLPLPHVA